MIADGAAVYTVGQARLPNYLLHVVANDETVARLPGYHPTITVSFVNFSSPLSLEES